ncbi:hypothetical protein VNO78_26636 [Psophocarpus tetragonolobus]|uniref:Uncharacterized protein n=1 Tax=Psophocarpus tetragonolobus TaxID=3891 RepID=A0AAN9S0W8_PSOTE
MILYNSDLLLFCVVVFMTAPIRFLIWDVLLSHTHGCQFGMYFCGADASLVNGLVGFTDSRLVSLRGNSF